MLRLTDLIEAVRGFMLEEVQHDITAKRLYMSPRLSAAGVSDYPSLLKSAIREHDDSWLAIQLASSGRMNATEQRRKPNGGFSVVRVPHTAPTTLAEGEFGRFYARGLCRYAMARGIATLVVYRAKEVENPRPESIALVGTSIDVQLLLGDLRVHIGVDTALRLPPGPNSGLSVRLPS